MTDPHDAFEALPEDQKKKWRLLAKNLENLTLASDCWETPDD